MGKSDHSTNGLDPPHVDGGLRFYILWIDGVVICSIPEFDTETILSYSELPLVIREINQKSLVRCDPMTFPPARLTLVESQQPTKLLVSTSEFI